jgi:DNA polymerase
MDAHRKRAWEALEIGPLWRSREASEQVPEQVPEPPQPVQPLTWTQLQQTVSGCTACSLSNSRQKTVFGVGAQPAPWMLVGEAPGQQEDASGEPFVGPAGQLLDQMLAAIGVNRRTDVFITNVLKCRPPANRDPSPEEVSRCEPYLKRQVDLVQPRLILVLGRFAAHSLLGTDASLVSLRGVVHSYASAAGPIPLVVTYHPAYLLRNLPEKARSWSDLCLARRTFDAAAGPD